MGKSDEYQYDYLDDNDRFADQINGALFHGRQIVRPEELEPADAQAVYQGKEAGNRGNFKTVADKVRMWQGKLLHVLAVENQSHVDYHMVLRQLFEVVRYGRDKESLRKILEENKEAYGRIDSDTKEMLEVVGKVRIGEEYGVMENGERRYDMCKAFLDMKLEGIEEGIVQI